MAQAQLYSIDVTDLGATLWEMETAEHNFNVIAAKANKLSSALGRISAGCFNAGAVHALILDLKAVYAFIRQDIKRRFPNQRLGRGRVADRTMRFPERIAQNSYTCLCPLTTLLREAAKSLTQLDLVKLSDDKKGGPALLHKVLKSLAAEFHSYKPNERGDVDPGQTYLPGLARCVMLHKQYQRFTVASTATRYNHLPGLSSYSVMLRHNHIQSLRGRVSREELSRIDQLENYSADIFERFSGLEKRDKLAAYEQWDNPLKSRDARVRIDGLAATYTAKGNYLPACMADSLRFVITTPSDIKKKKERAEPYTRRAYPPTSCAEWELWITTLADPPRASTLNLEPKLIPGLKRPTLPVPLHTRPKPVTGVVKAPSMGWPVNPQSVPIQQSMPHGRRPPPSQRAGYSQQRPAGQRVPAHRPGPTNPHMLANQWRPPQPAKKVKSSRGCCFF